MKTKIIAGALATLALPSFALAADTLLAGFTFSQFIGEGVPTTNAESFETTNFIVATYRGATIPNRNLVDGTIVGANGGTGYDIPTIGSWSFANFDINDGVSVKATNFGALNTANSTTVNGTQMHLTDDAGMGLTFGAKNTLWSIQVNDTGAYTNAAGADFSFAAVGIDGTATVEWLFDGAVFATSTIVTGGFNTYSLELDEAFYGNGVIEGRLTSGSIGTVTFDNTQFNGTAIPEPSTYAAFAGVAGLGLAVYRRRRSV